MSRTRSARALPSAAAAAAAALACLSGGCGAPAPERSLEVVARWADLAGPEAEGLPAPQPLRLDTATRDAIAVPPVSRLEVELDRAPQALRFSTAARGAAERPGRIRFGIQARVGGAWQTVFSEPAAGEGAWRDQRLDLTEVAPGARAFRFETRAEPAPEAVAGAEAWWGSIAWLGPAPRRRPDVILISLDTLGAAQLGAFGNVPGVSPHIDAFLEEGFSFRRALAQYGNTLVSHASLFTGLYPVHHRYYPGGPLMPVDSLVAELADAGWLTAAFTEGAFVSAAYGFGTGFDLYDDGALGLSRQMAGGAPDTFARAADWLEAFGRDTRFFLFVHTYEVHTPYAPREEADWRIVARILPGERRALPAEFQSRRSLAHNRGERPLSERELEHLRALQSAEIHGLDRELGRFFERLAALGLEDDTLVVLTADHGDQFGEHGKVGHSESLHNRVLHVPLAFRWPGRVVPGASQEPVQLIDVLPTVLELAGLPVPEGRDGRSLAGLVTGGARPAPRPAFAEQITARGECRRLGLGRDCRLDRYAVQTRRFKLISSRIPAERRLYDLRDDPLEARDVAAEHPEQVERLHALLEAYLAGTQPAPATGAELAPDPAVRERLEALGYLD